MPKYALRRPEADIAVYSNAAYSMASPGESYHPQTDILYVSRLVVSFPLDALSLHLQSCFASATHDCHGLELLGYAPLTKVICAGGVPEFALVPHLFLWQSLAERYPQGSADPLSSI